MQIEKFLERYNAFNVDEETTKSYSLIYANGNDEPWATFPAPLELEEFEDTKREIADNFALGKHTFRLVALSSTRSILGQFIINIEGRLNTGKNNPISSGQESLHHARAMAAHVSTSEQMLASNMARSDVIAQRELEAQQRLSSMQTEMHDLVQAVNKMMLIQESHDADIEIKRAQAETIRNIGAQLMPILGPLVMFASKGFEEWLKKKGINPEDMAK